MSQPTTPRRPAGDKTKDDQVPITPKHKSVLTATFQELSQYVGGEPDERQRQTIIRHLGHFVSALAQQHNVTLPDTAFAQKSKRGESEEESEGEEDSDDDGTEDDAMGDVQFTGTAKKDQKTLEDRLGALTLAIDSDVDTGRLQTVRDSFFRKLLGMRAPVMIDNKEQMAGFDEEEAVDITNFFFVEMMGPNAIHRLRSLIRSYSTDHPDGLDQGAAARARTLSLMDENPLSIRRFYIAFSRAQSTRTSPNSGLGRMYQVRLSMALLDQYNSLRRMAAQKDPALLNFLRGRGYQTERGVGWQSCTVRCLAESLEVSPTILQNICQSAQGVAALAEHFGNGILAILPVGAMNRLNRWGNQRMAHVYGLLRRRAPFLRPVCDALEEYVFDPIQAGAKLRIQQLKLGSTKPFLDLIIEAVRPDEAQDAKEAEDAGGEDGADDGVEQEGGE